MIYKPTKKKLKAGEELGAIASLCRYNVESWCKMYECTPEEAIKLYIETQENYIDIYFNYGYAMTDFKVKNFDYEYRCRATFKKITK